MTRRDFAGPLFVILLTGTVSAQTPLLNVKNVNGVRMLTSNADGSFLALGSFGVGVIPGGGTDVRLMWYPAKGAFRAGRAESGQWGDASIGAYSTATGLNTSATGEHSTAMGSNTTASGAGSSAFGMNTVASGSASTATGFLSTASGEIATAMGVGTSAQSYGSLVIGKYNVIAGAANTWVDTDPLFVAGKGTDPGTRANALTLFKNGRLVTAGQIEAPRLIAGNDGLLATGALNSGSIPATGSGIRMMWFPNSAAFRAGGVNASQWDAANIGYFSAAIGENTIASATSAIALGSNTTASGIYSTAMGHVSQATGFGSTAMGVSSSAGGNTATAIGAGTSATGDYSLAAGYQAASSAQLSVAIGYMVIASGSQSMALGNVATTNGFTGSFVYGDNSSLTPVSNSAANQFVARASGGTIFYSNSDMTAGVSLAAGGGAWASVSDVAKKRLFTDIDGEVVLAKIRAMPVREWSYQSQNASIRHLGPTAQDFYQAFKLGESNLTITTTDIDGVNLLAAQALEKRTTVLRAENAALKEEVSFLRREVAAIKALLHNDGIR